MAAVTLGVAAKTATLVANTADTVTLLANTPSPQPVEIINLDATNVIWVKFDATAATVAGDDCFPVPPNSTWIPPVSITTLSLISSGTPQYTISRIVLLAS